MKLKLFHIYRDGVQIWPVGIVCIRRVKGIGFGLWKETGSDLTVGLGIIFNIHLININWKV